MSYIEIDCPKCQGEGSIEIISGSYFDSYQEAYYPLEEIKECDKCFGAGTLEVSNTDYQELKPKQICSKSEQLKNEQGSLEIAAYLLGISIEELIAQEAKDCAA